MSYCDRADNRRPFTSLNKRPEAITPRMLSTSIRKKLHNLCPRRICGNAGNLLPQSTTSIHFGHSGHSVPNTNPGPSLPSQRSSARIFGRRPFSASPRCAFLFSRDFGNYGISVTPSTAIASSSSASSSSSNSNASCCVPWHIHTGANDSRCSGVGPSSFSAARCLGER